MLQNLFSPSVQCQLNNDGDRASLPKSRAKGLVTPSSQQAPLPAPSCLSAPPPPPAVLRHVLLHTESSVAEGPRRAVPATQAGFHSPPERSGQQGDTWPPSQALGFHHPALVQLPVSPAVPGRRAPAPTLPLLVLSACLDSDLEMSPNVPQDSSSLI